MRPVLGTQWTIEGVTKVAPWQSTSVASGTVDYVNIGHAELGSPTHEWTSDEAPRYPGRARHCLSNSCLERILLGSPDAASSLEGTRTDGVDVLFQRPASSSKAGSLATSHQSLMPQQRHGRCKADADTVREGRAQSASGGGDEGAVVPQLSLPPASGPLSCSRR